MPIYQHWELQHRGASGLRCIHRQTQTVTFHFMEAPYLCLRALRDKWQQIKAVGKSEGMKVEARVWTAAKREKLRFITVHRLVITHLCPFMCHCTCTKSCRNGLGWQLLIPSSRMVKSIKTNKKLALISGLLLCGACLWVISWWRQYKRSSPVQHRMTLIHCADVFMNSRFPGSVFHSLRVSGSC